MGCGGSKADDLNAFTGEGTPLHADSTAALEDGHGGWVRVAHGPEHGGRWGRRRHIVFDRDIASIRALAASAKRVKIQVKGDPRQHVVSKPDSYPIHDLRAGKRIGAGRELKRDEVSAHWESPVPALLDKMWHKHNPHCHGWGEGLDEAQGIYWAAGNGGGLHWVNGTPSGHFDGKMDRGMCRWEWMAGSDVPLELYIDAPEPPPPGGAAGPSGAAPPVVMCEVVLTAEMPIAGAPPAGGQKGAEPPGLIEIAELLKRELNLSGTVAQVIGASCESLGIETNGKNLSEQARECWILVGGGRA